jgi:hypothetical protein
MSSSSIVMLLSVLPLVLFSTLGSDAFTASKLTAAFTRRQRIHLPHTSSSRHSLQQQLQRQHWALHYGAADYYADEEDDDEDDDDDDDDILLDADSLGDWRAFRRNLASSLNNDSLTTSTTGSSTSASSPTAFLPDMNNKSNNDNNNNNVKKALPKTVRSISKENQELVLSQNEQLGKEYMSDVWAHETATVRISSVSFIIRSRVGVQLRGGKTKRLRKDLELHFQFQCYLVTHIFSSCV